MKDLSVRCPFHDILCFNADLVDTFRRQGRYVKGQCLRACGVHCSTDNITTDPVDRRGPLRQGEG